jgi:hypothetical protein
MLPRTPVFAALLLSTLGFIAGCSTQAASKGAPPPAASLVGTWRSKLQFESGVFAEVHDLECLYAFSPGGTVVESSNYDGAPPVPPAYGIWREVAPDRYEAKYVFFMTKAPATFGEVAKGGGWLPAGHGVVTENIRMAAGGDSLSSTITLALFDRDGNPVPGGGPGTGRGVRIRF